MVKKILNSKTLWPLIRGQVISFLKGEFIKLALKKILGSSAMGGFKGWLVKFIASELFDEIAKPLLELSIRKGFLVYDKIEGHITLKKVENAKKDHDKSDYLKHISGV